MSTASDDDEDEPVIRKRMPGRRVWPGGGRGERERAMILSDFRRKLSVRGAMAQPACLIGRVARVGEGHRLAARRAWVMREDESREDNSRAQGHASVIWEGVFRSRGLSAH